MTIKVYVAIIDVDIKYEYRKIQGLIGETSFSVILPKEYALNIGIGKGDFVKVRQEDNRIIIEKA
jgi:phosphate uptake regulator